MRWLELKIPPLLLVVLLAIAQAALAWLTPSLRMPIPSRLAGLSLALIAVGILAISARAFQREQTTVNPMSPQCSARLVTSGIFRWSRNPMYVGMALLLTAWTLFLESKLAFAAPVLFIVYITFFQIKPEERILREKFGAEYDEYCRRVRRWV